MWVGAEIAGVQQPSSPFLPPSGSPRGQLKAFQRTVKNQFSTRPTVPIFQMRSPRLREGQCLPKGTGQARVSPWTLLSDSRARNGHFSGVQLSLCSNCRKAPDSWESRYCAVKLHLTAAMTSVTGDRQVAHCPGLSEAPHQGLGRRPVQVQDNWLPHPVLWGHLQNGHRPWALVHWISLCPTVPMSKMRRAHVTTKVVHEWVKDRKGLDPQVT